MLRFNMVGRKGSAAMTAFSKRVLPSSIVSLATFWVAMTLLLTTGCTSVDFRRRQQLDCFKVAPEDQRKFALAKQLVVGMPECLVYIAWDRPWRTFDLDPNEYPGGRIEIFHTSFWEDMPANVPIRENYGGIYTTKFIPSYTFSCSRFPFKYAIIFKHDVLEWGYSESFDLCYKTF